MKIYRDNTLIYDLPIDRKTTIKRRLMVENSLNLSIAVERHAPLDLKIGDHTDIRGERYIIMDEPQYSLRAGVYEYSVLMRGNLHRLEVYMMPDDGRDEWFYYGSVIDQINKVAAVLNTKEPGWSVVAPDLSTIADTSAKNINYANMSVLSALHAICSAENGWGLEFDVVDKTIKFATQIKTPTAMSFEYGRGGGLYELTRGALAEGKIDTRIVGYGGTTNMAYGERLSFEEINGGRNYVESNVERYGLREARVNFDHIYPRRNSTITGDAARVEAGKANWTVVDSAMDFDLNAQIVEKPVIMFNTGDCVGVEFEIVHYDAATKTITFKEYVDQSGAEAYALPNAVRYPRSGDSYIFVNILMPDSYVAAAKHELLAATTEEAARRSVPQRSYNVKCDPRYFRSLGHSPLPGDACRIVDAPHGVDYVSRIVEINYPLIAPYEVELTLSEKIPIPGGVTMAKSVREIKTRMNLLDRTQLSEAQLRRIFHPLGGSVELDFSARVVEVAKKLIAGEIVSTDFVSGLLGDGFKIDANGNAEFGSLILRTFLMTPELIKNRIRTVSGDVWFSDSAVVSSVTADPVFALTAASGARIVDSSGRQLTTTYRGYYHVTTRDGEGKPLMTFAVDDILRGIYSYEDGTFSTVFLQVTNALRGSYLVRPLNGLAPAADMVLVRQGNYTNPLRQNAVYVSAVEGYVRVLGGVNDVTISLSNIKAQAGNLRGLHLLGVDNMPPDGLYAPGLVIHSSSVLGLDTTLTATADKLALQAKQIELKADLITLDAYVLSTGIFESTGLIKAALINVDSLVAKSIDTRINGKGKGVVIDRGKNIVTIYNDKGVQTVQIYEGAGNNQPTITLVRDGADITISPNGVSLGDPQGRRAEYLANGINMPSTARMNMPGVLAAGRVEKTYGNVIRQWGCKTCDGVKYNGQVGQYKITHGITHLDYYVTATPIMRSGQWNGVNALIMDKQPPSNGEQGYVVIGIFVGDQQNKTEDCDFEFMICGQN